MKKIFYIIAAVAALTFSSACNPDLLIEPQKGTYNESDFYKTESDCEAALAALYGTMLRTNTYFRWDMTINSLLADECYKSSSGYKSDTFHWLMLSTYDDTHDYVNTEFQMLYKFIYLANLVIDNFDGKDSPVYKQCVAEAKVIKAYSYIKLISLWGTPPLVKSVPKTQDEMRLPNGKPEELWAYTISTLDEAINSGALPSKKNLTDKTTTRATKEFAYALKGKAQVFSGDYSGAKTSLEAVMDSHKYDLIPGAELADKLYSTAGNMNMESVFEIYVNANATDYAKTTAGDQWMSYTPPRIDKHKVNAGSYLSNYKAGWGYYMPTQKFVKAIIANEGTNSNRFKAWFWTYEEVQALGIKPFNGLRTAANAKILADNPDPTKASTAYPSAIGADYAAEHAGVWNRKTTIPYTDMFANNQSYDGVSRRLMRYAEVLLLYAEACAQLNETSGRGLDALNQIANRAGAPTYTTLNMANVKKEKWFEMWMESCRFTDLVRWGDAPTELADHWKTFPVFFGYKEGKSAADLAADGKNMYDVYEVRQFDLDAKENRPHAFRKGQDEHLPFPASELANNPNLVQNSGWEKKSE